KRELKAQVGVEEKAVTEESLPRICSVHEPVDTVEKRLLADPQSSRFPQLGKPALHGFDALRRGGVGHQPRGDGALPTLLAEALQRLENERHLAHVEALVERVSEA